MGASGSRSAAAGPRPPAAAVLLAMDENKKSCWSCDWISLGLNLTRRLLRDFSGSVAWESAHPPPSAPPSSTSAPPPPPPPPPGHQGVWDVHVRDGKVELEGTSDTFVSYLVSAHTDLPTYASHRPQIRRRFHDFVFLRRALSHDFTACVVPPLPDKHRMEYVIGDRFSPEFIERRRQDLERFLQRVGRHPKLSRTEVFQAFLESTEWNVFKHKHHARSTSQDESNHTGGGVLDSLSDTLLNAFTKLKKPDERFVVIRQHLDSFEEGLASLERLAARSKTRMGDLSGDYEDLAVSVQGLGYLESGITDPLMRFERALVDFGANVKDHSALSTELFLEHVHSLLGYSHAFKGVLKLRDQKQLDFEELSAYLSNVVVERDRLANGYGYGMGLGSYFKEKVESLRGGETDMSRAARLQRLDAKIKELQDAVLHAQETSNAFNDQVLSEHAIFRATKRHEMKALLGAFADGQIRMHKQSAAAWDRTMPSLERIYVET
ncbi:hypothetical protein RHOSPDRAFT_30300 [Rhodotorula sp. JG-1b]|nr:hypothetical protein RHOSPDRAFT_30300 [Rhodotorula sp. JG-1b]